MNQKNLNYEIETVAVVDPMTAKVDYESKESQL